MPIDEWVRRAVCSALPKSEKDKFFIWDEQSSMAVKHCARCPVAWECFDYATGLEMNHGLWGGVPEGQRFAMQRRVSWDRDGLRLDHARYMRALKKTAWAS